MEAVVAAVSEADFDRRTPSEITVRDMLVHVLGFTEGFRQGATKEMIGRRRRGPDRSPRIGTTAFRRN